MLGREFAIDVDLGAGRHAATIVGCDLGTDYVRFNSEYSS
jgi:N-acetylglutamate synthase/N-acetylornithine aminotransferase